MEQQIPQGQNQQLQNQDSGSVQNTNQQNNSFTQQHQNIAQFGSSDQVKEQHQNINQFQQQSSPINNNNNHGNNPHNFSYQNFIQSKHQDAHYENQEDFLKHFHQDFRYHIMNVFYQWIKNSLYLIIFASTAKYGFENYETQGCYYTGPPVTANYQFHSQEIFQENQYINHHYAATANQNNKNNYIMDGHTNGQALIAMVFNTNIGLIFLNLISLVYMYVQDKFVKLEFYIIYGLNLIMSLLILTYAFYDQSKNVYVCYSAQMFYHAFLYITIKKEIEIGYILYKQISDTTTRQINLCSNCVFVYLLIVSPNQSHCTDNAETLTFAIEVTNILALAFFTVLNFGYKSCQLNEDTRRALKFITILLSAAFFMVYAMVLYNFNMDKISLQDDTCFPLRFALRNYQFIVPISMLGMIFVFHSLNKNFDEEFSLDVDGNQLHLKDDDDFQKLQDLNKQLSPRSHEQQQQQLQQQQQQQQGFQHQGSGQQQLQQQDSNNPLSPNFQQQQQQMQQNGQQALSPQNNNQIQNQGQNNLGFQSQNNINNNNNNNNQLFASPFKYQEQAPVTLEGLRNSYQGGQAQMYNQSPYNNSQVFNQGNNFNNSQQFQGQYTQQYQSYQNQY